MGSSSAPSPKRLEGVQGALDRIRGLHAGLLHNSSKLPDAEELARRSSRAARFGQPQGAQAGGLGKGRAAASAAMGDSPGPSRSSGAPPSRARATSSGSPATPDEEDDDLSSRFPRLVGTCERVEKDYLRLTSAPKAQEVRPPRVLRKALALAKARWLEARDYGATRDALRSVRQDLAVQGIADALTADVYATHGRIALEVADWPEFRRCVEPLRSVLRGLLDGPGGDQAPSAGTGRGDEGPSSGGRDREGHGDEGLRQVRAEFLGYELCLAAAAGPSSWYHSAWEAADALRGARVREGRRGSASRGAKRGRRAGGEAAPAAPLPSVAPGDATLLAAMAACRAFFRGNLGAFSDVHASAPRMLPYALDPLAERLRGSLFAAIAASHPRPVTVRFLQTSLRIPGRREAKRFARERGAEVRDGEVTFSRPGSA